MRYGPIGVDPPEGQGFGAYLFPSYFFAPASWAPYRWGAGLLIAVVGKMALPLFTKRWTWAPAIAILAFAGVAIMRWPLPWVFAVLAPVAVAIAWFKPAAKTATP